MSIRLCAVLFSFFAFACIESTTTSPEPTPDVPAEPTTEPPPPPEPSCSKCSGVTMPETFDPANLCEASEPLFDAVVTCVCGIPMQQQGKCLAECATTVCDPAGGQPDDVCANCIAVQCGPETGACLNDV